MREKGIKNYQRRDENALSPIQVKIPKKLKADFMAAIYPRPMVSVVEEFIQNYLQQIDGAFGVMSDQEYRNDLAAKEAAERDAQ